MANRLSRESSPYLLQHAANPVDWYPWGSEALERAKLEDKPILLSIGYAACHWCHVMEHESFEDPETAAIMNERFVNIKVDREERPDLDSIYMQAVQAMTGHGGWPMTVFLTPDGVPYYGGTYFPKEDRHGIPSFQRILKVIADAYRERKDDVSRTTASVREMYAAHAARPAVSGDVDRTLFDRAATTAALAFDERHGGFGGAPKFPPTMLLEWLMTRWARTADPAGLDIARRTFVAMSRGGIHDQVGGGFARYSVDDAWLVPHFEKMLYDNALLIRLGSHLWQATGDEEIRRATERAIVWVEREMTSPEGGFYSSLDADSEGEEGKFYVWTLDEIRSLLPEHAEVLIDYWGATIRGNFEGANILHIGADPAAIAARHGLDVAGLESIVAGARDILYERRALRVWPGRDEKILAAWNGLMIRALAEAARALDLARASEMAIRGGELAFARLVSGEGPPIVSGEGSRVFRTVGGSGAGARIPGFLEDYAALGLAALGLHELTLDTVWLERARRLGESIRALFWDEETEAFFDTPGDHEPLIVRPRDVSDNALPSGTSMTVELLLRLGVIFGGADGVRMAHRVLETAAEPMARYPVAFGHMLCAADMAVNGAVELALVGDRGSAELAALQKAAGRVYVPSLVVAGGDGEAVELLRGRTAVGGRATAYVCRGYSCDEPTSEPEKLRGQLEAAGRVRGG